MLSKHTGVCDAQMSTNLNAELIPVENLLNKKLIPDYIFDYTLFCNLLEHV